MRKKTIFFFLTGVVSLCGFRIAIAQQSKIDPAVWAQLQAKGIVRVLVQLDVITKPVGALTPAERLAQEHAIALAQSQLLVSLVQTTHRVGHLFRTIPGLSLEVGLDALTVLERSGRVVRVIVSRVGKPHLAESVPLVEADQAWAGRFKVSQTLWQRIQAKGIVPVLVQLNTPWQPEGKLSKG